MRVGAKFRTIMSGALLVLLALAATLSLYQGVRNALGPAGSQDFSWGPARAVSLGVDPYVQNPAWTPIEREQGQRLESPGLPSCYLLLWPYACMSWNHAKLAWMLSNLLFTWILLSGIRSLWLPRLSAGKFLALCLAVVASTPWRMVLGNGQHTLFSLAFFVLGYRAVLQKRRLLAGCLLAVSLYKYTVSGPLLGAVFLAGGGAAIAIAAAIHLALTVLGLHLLAIGPLQILRENLAFTHNLIASGGTDLSALFAATVPAHATPLWAFFGGILTVGVGWGTWRARRDDLTMVCLLAGYSLLIVYHRNYDLVMLVFAAALFFRGGRGPWRGAAMALFLANTWYAQRVIDQIWPNQRGSAWAVAFTVVSVAAIVALAFPGERADQDAAAAG